MVHDLIAVALPFAGLSQQPAGFYGYILFELLQLQKQFIKDALVHSGSDAAFAEHMVQQCSMTRVNQLCTGTGEPEPQIPDLEDLLKFLDRSTGSSGGGAAPNQAVVSKH